MKNCYCTVGSQYKHSKKGCYGELKLSLNRCDIGNNSEQNMKYKYIIT